jgi:hypothetical protein
VEVVTSDFHGAPRGPWQPGRARLLSHSTEVRAAKRVLTAKYDTKFWLFMLALFTGRVRAAGGKPVVLEIILDESRGSGAAEPD